jgi:hypothetical protein
MAGCIEVLCVAACGWGIATMSVGAADEFDFGHDAGA